jgi:uncharacterized cupredoxin-like copper-binding protein
MRRCPAPALVSALAVVAFAGCGENRGEAGRTGTTPAAETQLAQPKGLPVATVDVGETEYKLDPANPRVEKSGVITFKATNEGKAEHNIEVETPKGEFKLDENLKPGESGTLKVDLEPGTYTWYCPVDDHKGLGMVGKITVAGGPS